MNPSGSDHSVDFAGDFDVPSSREDVDRDSSWNQWLRNEIHTLFIEAFDIFRVYFCTFSSSTVFFGVFFGEGGWVGGGLHSRLS